MNNSARSQRSNYYTNEDNYYVSSHNTNDTEITDDHLTEGTCNIGSLNDEPTNLFVLCLFDSGSSSTLINDGAMSITIKPHLGDPQRFTTTQGVGESLSSHKSEIEKDNKTEKCNEGTGTNTSTGTKRVAWAEIVKGTRTET